MYAVRPLGVHSENTRHMYKSIVVRFTGQSRRAFFLATNWVWICFVTSMLQVKTPHWRGNAWNQSKNSTRGGGGNARHYSRSGRPSLYSLVSTNSLLSLICSRAHDKLLHNLKLEQCFLPWVLSVSFNKRKKQTDRICLNLEFFTRGLTPIWRAFP